MDEWQLRTVPQSCQNVSKAGSTPETEPLLGVPGIVNATNTRRECPTSLGIQAGSMRKIAGDHRGRIALQFPCVSTLKGGSGAKNKRVEAQCRRTVQRDKMRLGSILNRQTTIQELVGLKILSCQLAMGVVVLREESPRPEHHACNSMLSGVESAQPFGGELSHPIDIARSQGTDRLIDPDRGIPRFIADGITDHQRGGRGEDEAIVSGFPCGFQQVEGAGDIYIDEGLRRMARDIWLVKSASVDNRLDAAAEGTVDGCSVRNRSNYVGVGAWSDIETRDVVTEFSQPWRKKSAEPSGGAGKEDMHVAILPLAASGCNPPAKPAEAAIQIETLPVNFDVQSGALAI